MARKADTTVSLDDVEAANANQKARESKRDDRLTKDLMYGQEAYKRSISTTQQERDTRYARLHSFGGGPSSVQMFWDFDPQAIERQLFKLRVGKEEVVLSAVELQKYLRWV